MTSYYRLMLGRKSVFAEECFRGGFIGVDFDIAQDLTGDLSDDWRSFNKAFVPVYLDLHNGKTKISAGLACGALWTVAKGMTIGDVILCPDGTGTYHVGSVIGDYTYAPSGVLPHRRVVRWLSATIQRSAMSQALRNSTGSIGTVSDISDYRDEIVALIGMPDAAHVEPRLDVMRGEPMMFRMEAHLEDFLIRNWHLTDFASDYDIVEEDGRKGQFPLGATQRIDILARSKDGSRLLVIELKRADTSDVVVGQILRYMGYVLEQIAEPGQSVEGAIIALEDDQKLRWALKMVPSVNFYRYQVSFTLSKG